MQVANRDPGEMPSATPSSHSPLAPLMMMAFWMLLGGAAGIRAAQSIWQGPGEAADLNALPPKQRSTEAYPVGSKPGPFLAKLRSDADEH